MAADAKQLPPPSAAVNPEPALVGVSGGGTAPPSPAPPVEEPAPETYEVKHGPFTTRELALKKRDELMAHNGFPMLKTSHVTEGKIGKDFPVFYLQTVMRNRFPPAGKWVPNYVDEKDVPPEAKKLTKEELEAELAEAEALAEARRKAKLEAGKPQREKLEAERIVEEKAAKERAALERARNVAEVRAEMDAKAAAAAAAAAAAPKEPQFHPAVAEALKALDRATDPNRIHLPPDGKDADRVRKVHEKLVEENFNFLDEYCNSSDVALALLRIVCAKGYVASYIFDTCYVRFAVAIDEKRLADAQRYICLTAAFKRFDPKQTAL